MSDQSQQNQPQASSPKSSLREKLVTALGTIGVVAKRGNNQKQGYAFVKATDVANEVRDALAEVGVFMSYDVLSERTWEKPTQSGGVLFFCSLHVAVTFHDQSSDETITARVIGWGSDSLDKAPYKAMTGALKYALRMNFLIPDEEDPENDDHGQVVDGRASVPATGRPPQQRPSESQRAQQTAKPGEPNRGHGKEGEFRNTAHTADAATAKAREMQAEQALKNREDSEKIRSHAKHTVDTTIISVDWKETQAKEGKPSKPYGIVNTRDHKFYAWDTAMFGILAKAAGKEASLCIDDVKAQYPKLLDIAYLDGKPLYNLVVVDPENY